MNMKVDIIWTGLHCFIPNYGELFPERIVSMDQSDAENYVSQGKAKYLTQEDIEDELWSEE